MKFQGLSKLFGHIMTVLLEFGSYLRKVVTQRVAWNQKLRISGPQTALRPRLIGTGFSLTSSFALFPTDRPSPRTSPFVVPYDVKLHGLTPDFLAPNFRERI